MQINCTKMHLTDRLRPDLPGSLHHSHRSPAVFRGLLLMGGESKEKKTGKKGRGREGRGLLFVRDCESYRCLSAGYLKQFFLAMLS